MYDDDVVEEKNIKYQNFNTRQIGLDKTEALCDSYSTYLGKLKRLSKEDIRQLAGPDTVFMICVDNAPTRKEVYNAWAEQGGYFVDSRAEGRTVSLFTPGKIDSKTKAKRLEVAKKLSATLPDTTEGGSCQLKFELEKNIIQLGNQIVAPMAAQFLLNHVRGVGNPEQTILRF